MPRSLPLFLLVALASITAACGGGDANANTPSGDASAATAEPTSNPISDQLPPEFFNICSDKEEGAACEVTLAGTLLVGRCLTPPPESGEKRRVCKPDNLPSQ